MQGGRDPFDRFAGFGHQRSLVSEFFGGRDPFDDPFFRSPFGGMFDSNFFGPMGSPFANLHNGGPFANFHNGGPFANFHNRGSFANLHNGGPFMNSFTGGPSMDPNASGFIEHQPHQPNPSRGLVIEELNSDDEKEEEESGKMKKENPRKHGRSCEEPIVDDSDDEATERKSKHIARRNDVNQMQHARMQPGMNSFTFQSSSVSYGGANGAFYTTSTTRRSGSDGLSYEEFREADSSTRQATHRVSKGIHDKGVEELAMEGGRHYRASRIQTMEEIGWNIQEEQNLMLAIEQLARRVVDRTEESSSHEGSRLFTSFMRTL